MPYIDEIRREQFDRVIDQLDIIEVKGDLEYCIFKMMRKYMNRKTWNYSNLHDTTYAAVHCGDEFKRRYLDQREDQAIQKNGDIK